MKTKVCNKCKQELPLTIEYFQKVKINNDGFCGKCKKCVKIYTHQYHKSNIEKITINNKKYRKEHKEEISAIGKQYYIENRESKLQYQTEYAQSNQQSVADYQKQYNIDNKEYLSNQHKEYSKGYYIMNKESLDNSNKIYYRLNREMVLNRSRQYYSDNSEYVIKRCNIYRKNNKEKYITIAQRSRTRKQGLSSTLTNKQWGIIKKDFNNRCCYCGEEKPLAREHFLALSKKGEFTINNVLPSCCSCNSSKGTKDFFIWYPKYKYYDKKREVKILKYLNYKNNIQQLTFAI